MRAGGSRLSASDDGCRAVTYSAGQELSHQFFQFIEISEPCCKSKVLGASNSWRPQNEHGEFVNPISILKRSSVSDDGLQRASYGTEGASESVKGQPRSLYADFFNK